MPKAKITKTVIDQAPYTKSGQNLLWDTELKGFGLCINQQSKTFIVQRNVNGISKRITIGRYGVLTPDQARKLAIKNILIMSQGIDPNEEKKERRLQSLTLDDLADEFFKARNTMKDRTKASYRYCLNKYASDWLHKPVTHITPDKFKKLYFYVGENHGHTTANGIRRILSSILNYGIAAHNLFDKNPVRIIADTKSAYPNKRRRNHIKPHQLPAWWKAVHEEENDTGRDYLLLILFTGLRRNEASKLRWSDVDFRGRTITISETKNGEPLTLPLSDYLQVLLEKRRMRYGNYEYVFPGRGKSGHIEEPKKVVYRVKDRTGIEFSVHDLRRTFASIVESLDISFLALKHLLNHKTSSDVTSGYVIFDVERLRDPVQKVADYILEQVSKKEDIEGTV